MPKTVNRAIEAIKLLGREPSTLTDLAIALDVHKSTALRLLQTLEQDQFARRLPNGRYALGLGLVPLAQQALAQVDLRGVARQRLIRLAEELGHTVHLAQLLDDQVIYIDKIEGHRSVAMTSAIGQPAELHTAAVAKVILAHLDDARRNRLLSAASFERHTDTTIGDRESLDAELRVVAERGWAVDAGEKEHYLNCIAVPIFDSVQTVTAGLSATALREIAHLNELVERVGAIRDVAESISRDLGWKGSAREF